MKLTNYIVNSKGGCDLLVEKDAGNPIRITTGNIKNSLEFWKYLKLVCDTAIIQIEDNNRHLRK